MKELRDLKSITGKQKGFAECKQRHSDQNAEKAYGLGFGVSGFQVEGLAFGDSCLIPRRLKDRVELEQPGYTLPRGQDKNAGGTPVEREFFIGNLLVRIHLIIVMIRWAGLAPWEFEFPFPGCLTSTFLQCQ